MTTININEQIAFLRKQKGLTQENLATVLGVTNQAVSKWESGQCYPDIQFLPDMARLFEVTIDELLGYKTSEQLGDICLKIKDYFKDQPENESMSSTYRLAALLHEVAITDGYKKHLPWKENKNYSTESMHSWGLSISSEPEGSTARNNNCICFTLGKEYAQPTISELRNISLFMKQLSNLNYLKVMFALYHSTLSDFDLYISVDTLAAETALHLSEIEAYLKDLPVEVKEEKQQLLYRLKPHFYILPPLISFFNIC